MSKIPASDPIKFGEFMPDVGDFNNGGSLLIKNAIPYGEVYKPFADLAAVTNALATACKGSFSYRDSDGNVTIFAGTLTKLYKLSGTSWTDVTRASGDYTTGSDGFWDFVNFGTLVIATNYNDDIQVFDTATDTQFSQLSATAPRCRRMAIVKNFLVCVDTVDGDGAIGYRVRWSPLADPQGVWTDSITTQADHQDISGGDYSNSFVAQIEEYGVIVQGRSIWRMDYVGGDAIFSINPLYTGRGSLLPRSCISNGKSLFILAEDGWYQLEGGELTGIGDKKIDKYFYSIFDQTNDFNLNVQIDPLNKLLVVAFPTKDAGTASCDMMMLYNWADKKWSQIVENTDCLFSYISTGYNMDNMDSIFPSVDAMPFSLDSRLFTGGKTSLGAFTTTHALGTFTGDTKTALLQTSEIRPNSSGFSIVDTVIPYIEGKGTISARLGSRSVLGDDPTWTDFVSQNPYTGEIDLSVESVFHRAEVQISGSWTIANSIAVRAKPTGSA